jgi:hypothetical protein
MENNNNINNNLEKQDSNNSIEKQQPKTFLEKFQLKIESFKEMIEIRKKNLEEGKDYDFSKNII